MAPEVTSTEVVRREPAEIAVPAGPGLVQPIADLSAIVDMFTAYQKCVKALLVPIPDGKRSSEDYQRIGSKDFKKKSAWRKLATAFGISGERVSAEDDFLPDGRIRRAKRTVRAIAPNGRSMDGEGVCDIYERCCEPGCSNTATSHDHCPAARSEHCPGWTHFSHAEHDIPTTAYTRALNRAVSDLIGAGEVSAEEIVGEGEDGVPHRRHNGNGNGEASAPAYDGKLITSQYDGKCVVCEGPIKKGDQVVYKKGKGAWHPTCDPRAGDGADVEPSKDAEWQQDQPEAAPTEKVETVGDQNAPMTQAQRDLHQRLVLTIAKSAGQPKPTMEAGLRQIGSAIGLDNLTAWEYDAWTVAQADAAAKALTKELKDLQDAKKEAGGNG